MWFREIVVVRKKGFTLIELLVVISIIAMLLAILMPALGKVKEKARDVVCRSSLKQWGLTWGIYTNDHNGYFPDGVDYAGTSGGWARGQWITVLEDEWAKHPKMLICPSATKPNPSGEVWAESYNQTYVMGYYGDIDTALEAEVCSYGMNNWAYNIPGASLQGREAEKHWRNSNVSSASRVPLFIDAMWRGGGPDYDQGRSGINFMAAPDRNGQWIGYNYEMMHFALDRHNGGVGVLFMDSSVRHVGIKELWELKWHRSYDTNYVKTLGDSFWPEWMKRY